MLLLRLSTAEAKQSCFNENTESTLAYDVLNHRNNNCISKSCFFISWFQILFNFIFYLCFLALKTPCFAQARYPHRFSLSFSSTGRSSVCFLHLEIFLSLWFYYPSECALSKRTPKHMKAIVNPTHPVVEPKANNLGIRGHNFTSRASIIQYNSRISVFEKEQCLLKVKSQVVFSKTSFL